MLSRRATGTLDAALADYRPEIDSLRAVAVLAVIAYHFSPAAVPSGYLGVDIFFVISGYVVTASVFKRGGTKLSDWVLGFYARRVRRLLPAVVLCVTVTTVVGLLFVPPVSLYHMASLRTGIAALFGCGNMYLLKQSTDYFGANVDLNLFTHTWSLGVEEQFYVVYPLLLALFGFANTQHGHRRIRVALWGLTFLSAAGYVLVGSSSASAAFFLMPLRFWELGLGSLAYLQFREGIRKGPAFEGTLLVALMAMLWLPRAYHVPATFGTALFTFALLTVLRGGSLARLMSVGPLVFVGRLSYSLYLWHWSVLVISRWTVGVTPWTLLAQIPLIVLLAYGSYRWVESPLRHAKWAPTHTGTIAKGAVLSAVLALVLFAASGPAKGLLFSGEKATQRLLARSESKLPGYSSATCHLTPSESPTETHCRVLSPAGKPTVFFVGNSHADHLRGLADELHVHGGLSLDGWSQSDCQFPQGAKPYRGCNGFQKSQHTRIVSAAREGDLVVVANRAGIEDWSGKEPDKNLGWLAEPSVRDELTLFARRLAQKRVALIVFEPTPEFQSEAALCTPEWFRPDHVSAGPRCRVEQSTLFALRAHHTQQLSTLVPSILRYDPGATLCPSGTCSHFDALGRPLYSDDNHLSDHGARSLYTSFTAFLRQHALLP